MVHTGLEVHKRRAETLQAKVAVKEAPAKEAGERVAAAEAGGVRG